MTQKSKKTICVLRRKQKSGEQGEMVYEKLCKSYD